MNPRTRAVHAGERLLGSKAHPLSAPVYASAVGYFDSADDLDASLDGKDFVYTRISSQNGALLEQAVASLEGAEDCAAYATGMAALKALIEAQGFEAGDKVVIPADGYGATKALFKRELAARGAELVSLELAEAGAPARIAELKPRFVLAETVTNPLLSVPDLDALSAACKKAGATLAVDATFPSPALHRALEHGADYSVHSTTKWMNGHSDAMGGVISGSKSRIEPLKAARVLDGNVLGPFEAWLTLRGLRTLFVRMEQSSASALRIAQRLEASPKVERVIYPGLPEHPHHGVAKRMLSSFGGMLAFHMKDAGRQAAFAFLEGVKIARPAPSLGDVATLVMHAASASARRLTPEERAAAGIGENLIRVSVGLEDPDDVADDLLQALP